MIHRLCIFCIVFLGSLSFSFAQNSILRSAFFTIDSLYNAGSYLSAEVEARRLLEYANLNDTAYAEIHKYIAFSLIAQGKTDLAKERFVMLLSVCPTYSLDPVLTSPKILVVFNEALQAFLSTKKTGQESSTIPMVSGKLAVSYRTMLFPGWEQLHDGRKTPGTIFLCAGIATLASALTCELLRNSARIDYLAEKDPLAFDNKYNVYNRYYRAEIASFIAFGLTYIASEIDVFTASSNSSFTVQSSSQTYLSTGIIFSVHF
jgi:hypothetical protein